MTQTKEGVIPDEFRGRKIEVHHLAFHHNERKCSVQVNGDGKEFFVGLEGEGFFPQSGGSSYNVAYGLKKLGLSPAIMGAIGDDFFSEQLEDTLEKDGIPLLAIPRGKGTPITLSCVDSVHGDTTLFNFKPAYDLRMDKAVDSLKGKSYDFVLATGVRMSEVELMIRLFTEQPDNLLIPNSSICKMADEHSVAMMLRLTNIIQVNFEEAQALSNCVNGDLEEMATKILGLGPKKAIITMAENGAFLGRKSKSTNRLKPCKQEALPAEEVDSDGAGDAFAVGFAWALRQKLSVQIALKVGAFVAARNIEGFGGYGGMPTREQVAQIV